MRRKINISVNKRIIKNIKAGTEDAINDGINIVNKYKEKKDEERKKRIFNISNNNEDKQTSNKKPIILSFVVIILFFLTYTFVEYAPIFGFDVFNNNSSKDVTIENLSSDENIYRDYNNELLVYSNQVFDTYNSNGKKTWEYKLDDNITPDIYINGLYMVAVNKVNGNIYIFSNKNEIANKKIDGIIDDVFLDDKGNIAVEYSSSGYKKVITVIDKLGNDKYSAYVNSDAIVDLKVLDNGNKLILIQTDSTSLTVGTKISMINSAKDGSIQDLTKLSNTLVFNSKIVNDDLILITNNNIEKYNLTTGVVTEIHSLDTNQTNYIAMSNNYFAAIESNKDKFNFITDKFDNTNISNVNLNVLPKYIKNSGFLTYIVSENDISVINKWGITVKDVSIKLPPTDIIIFNNEKSAGLIYSNRIEIIKL